MGNSRLRNWVNIEKNNNTRHLGGYLTKEGRLFKEHKVIRSGLPTNFSEADMEYMKAVYGLNKIIDFRADNEVKEYKSQIDVPGIEYVHIPLFDVANFKANQHKANPLAGKNKWIDIFFSLGGSKQAVIDDMAGVYASVMTSQYSQEKLREYFDHLLANEEGCILFHCTGGKDRTGIAALLLLYAVGVDLETCYDDYLRTNEFLRDYIEENMKTVREETDDSAILEGLPSFFGVNKPSMEYMLSIVKEEFGSLDIFLEEVIGLNKEKTERLKELYTEA